MVTSISTGLTYTLRGADNIYIDDFLELRVKNKNGTATAHRIAGMQTLRPRIVNIGRAVSFKDMFHIDQQWTFRSGRDAAV